MDIRSANFFVILTTNSQQVATEYGESKMNNGQTADFFHTVVQLAIGRECAIGCLSVTEVGGGR